MTKAAAVINKATAKRIDEATAKRAARFRTLVSEAAARAGYSAVTDMPAEEREKAHMVATLTSSVRR
jgi:hypothetical protein